MGEAVGGRVQSPQFVGRGEQLDLLGAAFELASGGRTTTVLVGGEAGGGKTRLVEEFSKRARDDGAVVATGVCVPTDAGGLPYASVVGIVRDVARQLDGATAGIIGPVARGLGIHSIEGTDRVSAGDEPLPIDDFA